MKNTDNKNKIFKHIPTFIFLTFAFGMGVWFVFSPKSDYSSSEKRYLQKFPETSFENIKNGTFGNEFESYFADHFPMRNFWVGVNAYYNLCTGNNGANGVYNAKDGYLINTPVPRENNVEKNINVVVKFSESLDIPLSVMIAPSTGYIVDESLPSVHNSYNDDEYFESSQKTLSSSNIDFIDLRDTFKAEQKNNSQLYYKTDHHWTTLGAYTAYTELCKNLGLTAKPKDSFDIETYNDFYGTTYSSSGFWLTPPDTVEVWNNPENSEKNISVKITDGTKIKESNSLYFYEHIEKDDKYPVFLDGNHALTEITNKNAERGTIVLIKDSFSHSLAPFLAEHYQKVVLVDMRYYKLSVSQLAKSENAEQIVVLYGIDNFATDSDIVWLN